MDGTKRYLPRVGAGRVRPQRFTKHAERVRLKSGTGTIGEGWVARIGALGGETGL